MGPIRAACVAAATLFLAAVPVSTASAATLHVDIQSLGGPCSDARTDVEAQDPATPWCTVGKALAAAAIQGPRCSSSPPRVRSRS